MSIYGLSYIHKNYFHFHLPVQALLLSLLLIEAKKHQVHMEDKALNDLLERYRKGKATQEDLAFLESWYLKYNQQPYAIEETERKKDVDQVWTSIQRQNILPAKTKLWPRIAAIAAAVAAITLGTWLYIGEIASSQRASGNDTEMNSARARMNDISPGRNLATLTLGNGKVITLDTNKTNVIVTDSVKTMTMLTAATPRGGTYQVTLPDGSKVWLNAASKISFPSLFNGNERRISLAGEAYFEVSPNKSRPFIVESTGQEIRVLGTHFNVNTYADEGTIKTTLLEGSVRVSPVTLSPSSNSGHHDVTLKPGQQSVLGLSNKIAITQVDLAEAVAWKNGDFVMHQQKLSQIMRSLERWYNIEVVYSESVELNQTFSGSVSRSKNISEILSVLESTKQLKFNINGRKILVTK